MAGNHTEGMSNYISGHHSSVLKSHTMRNAHNSAPHLLPLLDALAQTKPDFVLLDVGCGPGTISISFARLYPSAKIVGIDPSPEVIEKAKALAAEQRVSNVTFMVGDIYALESLQLPVSSPSPTSSANSKADVVHAHQVLQHISSPSAALQQMLAITSQDGIVSLREAVFSSTAIHPISPQLTMWRDLWLKVARSNGHDPDLGAKLLTVAQHAGVPKKKMLSSGGANVVGDDELRKWWAESWAQRCIESDFPKMVIEKAFGGQEELRQMKEGFEAWGRCDDGWYAILQGELIIQT